MSEHERQKFLADVHVGVISIERVDGPPLTVPIWYGYEPGGLVWIITGAESVKGRLLQAAQRFSLCAQTEEPPFYKYVSVEGPATIEPRTVNDVALASRYLGAELGEWYAQENPQTAASVTLRLRPEHWRTYDFAKLFG